MPKLVPQNEKTVLTVQQQPDKSSSKIQVMIMMDIGGATGNHMSEVLQLTPSRVSVIRNSPLYMNQLRDKHAELEREVLDKQSTRIASGDPVEMLMKEHCLEAVETKIGLMRNSISDVVRSGAASDLLDRGGYKPHTARTSVSIEVTEKMASRFEKVFKYDEHTINAGEATITIKKEVSS